MVRRTTAQAGLLTVSIVAVALAQPGARTTRVQDTLRSPVIAADGRVTFQLYAPKATDVSLRTEGPAPFANQKLAKGDSGVWTLTAQTPPDLYIYWYDVDGVAVADPRNNRPRVNMTTVRSLLEVPGPLPTSSRRSRYLMERSQRSTTNQQRLGYLDACMCTRRQATPRVGRSTRFSISFTAPATTISHG
jgi:hypothetical protein